MLLFVFIHLSFSFNALHPFPDHEEKSLINTPIISKHKAKFTRYVTVDTVPKSREPEESKGIVEFHDYRTDTTVFSKVEINAESDRRLWKKHLEKSLPEAIIKAKKKKRKPGTYSVYVLFIVERDGSVSNAKVLKDPGSGLATEAVTILTTGPKWNPGEINGTKVRSYCTQKIVFEIPAN